MSQRSGPSVAETTDREGELKAQLALQFAISRAFAEADRLEEISSLLVTALVTVLRWKSASLWVPDCDSGRLRCIAVHPRDPDGRWSEGTASRAFAPGEGLPGRVWASGNAAWIADTQVDANFPRRELAREADLGHGFAFPVIVRGEVEAVVELFGARTRELDAEQAEFLEAIGHQLSSFLERTASRQAVEQSEARKAGILRGAVDAIVSADREGRIVEFNEAAEALFGHARADVLDARIADVLVPPNLRAAHVAGLERYTETRDPHIIGRRIRTRAARADGSTIPIELTVTEAMVSGQPVFTAFIRDISREQEAELARDRFLELLSHELRTPVTAIYGGTRLLARPALDAEARRSLVEDVGAEADRLYRLVEDLIVLARAERGADAITMEPVNLDRIAERVVSAFRTSWPALEFRIAGAGPGRAARGEETYVEQLLRNLLSNAAKYAGEGRTVDVVIEHAPGQSTVRVLDRGPGVDPQEAERLFDIDYRSPRTIGLASGSGIGLFVVRWLVEAMGGRIWAAPRPGGGSEFGFTLQAMDDDADGSERGGGVVDLGSAAARRTPGAGINGHALSGRPGPPARGSASSSSPKRTRPSGATPPPAPPTAVPPPGVRPPER